MILCQWQGAGVADGAQGGVLVAARWVLLACNGAPSAAVFSPGTRGSSLGIAAVVVVKT